MKLLSIFSDSEYTNLYQETPHPRESGDTSVPDVDARISSIFLPPKYHIVDILEKFAGHAPLPKRPTRPNSKTDPHGPFSSSFPSSMNMSRSSLDLVSADLLTSILFYTGVVNRHIANRSAPSYAHRQLAMEKPWYVFGEFSFNLLQRRFR